MKILIVRKGGFIKIKIYLTYFWENFALNSWICIWTGKEAKEVVCVQGEINGLAWNLFFCVENVPKVKFWFQF